MGLVPHRVALRTQELRKTPFNTCSSSGVNLGLRCIYLAHTSPGTVCFRVVWLRFGPRWDPSSWKLRGVTTSTRGQNKCTTGQSPEQPGLSFLTPVPPGAGARVRGPATSASLCTTPEAVQRPRPSGQRALTRGQRLSRHGGTRQQQRWYSRPSRGAQPAPVRLGRDRALLLWSSLSSWREEARPPARSSRSTVPGKALRERERGKQGRRLPHLNHGPWTTGGRTVPSSRRDSARSSRWRVVPCPAIGHHLGVPVTVTAAARATSSEQTRWWQLSRSSGHVPEVLS